MKKIPLIALSVLCFTACQKSGDDVVLSQIYVHKYGFETTGKEWEEREQDGQIITQFTDGVKISRTYENGQLHGPTTYTFPFSQVTEKLEIYDQGTLLKKSQNDFSGMPIQEEVFEFDNRRQITFWDDKGAPLSIEEYEEDQLVEGKYFNADHELESTVELGFGKRVNRDHAGFLLSREGIENGRVVSRTIYHPNGQVHTISHYEKDQLHGQQQKFSASGQPLLELTWDHDVLHGIKTVYRNGHKIATIPYIQGEKHGKESHFDDLQNLVAEIEWSHDQKHGFTKLYSEEGQEVSWFYKGQHVSEEKFQVLHAREKAMADIH